jgi:putative ABC transport system permease protein
MNPVKRLSKRLRAVFRKDAVERELDQEMAYHLDLEIQKNLRAGMSPDEARRQAHISFGGVERYKQQTSEARAFDWIGGAALDVKLGARMLVKYPGLSVIGGLALAAAIGLGAAGFVVTQQLTEPRLPFPDGDRIVRIDLFDAAASRVEPRALYDFQLWREQLTSVDQLGAYRSFERNLITADGSAQPTTVAEISPSAFALTGVAPMLGRTLIETDAEPGSAEVVVIGYDVWQSRLNGARDVVGRTVSLARTPATIVGVMPEGFRFPVDHQLWVPLRLTSALPREGPGISIFGRLTDGATLASAQAELTTIGQAVTTQHATTHAQLRPRIALYAAPLPGAQSDLVRLSNMVAWLILAAACGNVATLVFARTATREAEIVMRNALGASRARVMLQLFVEAFVLCVAAAIVGLIATQLAFEYVVGLLPALGIHLPFWWQLRIGPATILYTVVLALGGAALVALLPAIKATSPRVQTALTKLASGGTNMRFGGVWSVVIVLQVTSVSLCLPIVLGTALISLRKETSIFPAHEYLTVRTALDQDPTLTITDYRAHRLRVYAELERRLEAEPSVAAVTFGTGMPGMPHAVWQLEAQRDSRPPFLVLGSIDGARTRVASVDLSFFEAGRVPLLAGRAFHAGDLDAENTVIVNESLARSIGGNALGVRLRYGGSDAAQAERWYEVVGIVRDAGMDRSEDDFMYLPRSVADMSTTYVAVHVRGDAGAFAPTLREIATQTEPELRLYDLSRLDDALRRGDPIAIPAISAVVALTILVMSLSAGSLYSLMSVAVERRTREIGIRVAIGATRRRLLATVLARAATQVGVGIAAGNVLLLPMMDALGNSEPLSEMLPAMLGASGIMLLVGLIACGVPARRALRIHPTEAIRYGG